MEGGLDGGRARLSSHMGEKRKKKKQHSSSQEAKRERAKTFRILNERHGEKGGRKRD